MAAWILILKHAFPKSTKIKCVGGFHSVSHRHFSVVIEIHTRQIRLINGPELGSIFVILWHKAFDNVVDKINTDSKEYCYRLAWKEIERQFVGTWSCVMKCEWTKGKQEVWRMEDELDEDAVCHRFYSIPKGNTATYLGKSWRFWRLQSRRARNTHCVICRWPNADGLGHDW
jgi:hypothetical protein